MFRKVESFRLTLVHL